MISDINPHFIKLDMHLIRDIDKDFTRQSLVKSFTEFASYEHAPHSRRIETKSELVKLIEIGVHYGQCYYMARPEAAIAPISAEVLR
jgi:EAL domain-containing protein (putative c-di-GMP-specific phosphodiesterase class I)